jgi:hypothetical protein
MFAERYARSLQSSDLRDDSQHTATEALFAAAIAGKTGAGLGALLSRVKYADGTPRQAFEAGSNNLARLLAIWLQCVTAKGKQRNWLPARTEWDAVAQQALFRRVAMGSLAYWIDSRCGTCHGTGQHTNRRLCGACKGCGRDAVAPTAPRLERELIADMVSELEGMVQAHNARAAGIMRRRAA